MHDRPTIANLDALGTIYLSNDECAAASKVVAGFAHDADDLASLLDMLGIGVKE